MSGNPCGLLKSILICDYAVQRCDTAASLSTWCSQVGDTLTGSCRAPPAKRRGRLPANGSGMSDVVHWLFNDGASSRLGADVAMPDSMSVVSLQARAPTASRVRTVSGYPLPMLQPRGTGIFIQDPVSLVQCPVFRVRSQAEGPTFFFCQCCEEACASDAAAQYHREGRAHQREL